ncbi:imidazolonepropionase [Terrabacter carboxydivorans]|uniref:Imidazolonepropionase n=1 Tax=Terrabacter carboxydivorans TaxID=619730 RepID=A0ABN3LBA0_9MICO
MSLLLTGIAELTTNDPARGDGQTDPGDALLGIVRDAALVVSDDGDVEWVGPERDAPDADERRDLGGRAVVPGFVDSHSHLVFAGDRSAEFAARMTGTPYDGGGIAVSVAATRAASDDELRALVAARVAEMRAQGTTTVEIKSGYGLTLDDELRSLRIARELTPHTTFLGAHVVPREYATQRAAYVDLVTGPMLDAVVADGPGTLAESIDVFCEPHSAHAFDGDEARTILEAGRAAGLSLRVHGNQLGHGPGVRLACELGARSVDHCTFLDADDVDALVAARGTTVATLLPGVEFSTRSPYPDGRALIDAGVDVALASDCNPGTCYSSSIPFAIALAVREMGLTPAEALHAATAVSARSLGLDRRVAPGQPAELAVLDAPSHLHLAYRAGVPIARALEL